MISPDPDAPQSFMGLFTFHDQEVFGRAELIQFYGVQWIQPTFCLSKGEEYAIALLDFKHKSIKLYDCIEDKWPKKIVDFELSLAANFYIKDE